MEPLVWVVAASASAVVGGTPGGEAAAVALGTVGAGGEVEVACTGVALHPRWVLTAAHCVELLEERADPAAFVGSGPAALAAGGAFPREASHLHPSYDGTATWDLGLVEVSEALPTWRPWEGPPPPAVDARITFTGFGTTGDGASDAGTKRTAELGILDVQPTTLLAYEGGSNLCTGDSGAPGVVDGLLVGIASEIVSSCLGGQSIATLTAPAADWITALVPPAPEPPDPAPEDGDPACCSVPPSSPGLAVGLLVGLLARRQRATSTSRTGSARS